jgi:glycosyltransferase involved in cell wall biosynthesis
MRVCLVSAMFYDGRKVKVDFRPEVLLESGLRALGIDVFPHTHWDLFNPADFDIVHVHHLGIGALRAAFTVSRVPLIYTNHDLRAKYGLLSPTKRLAFRAVLASADTVVALSALEADFLSHTYKLTADRIALIPNGIDHTSFPYARRAVSGRNAPFRLLYVGQLTPLKGLEILFAALRSVNFNWTLDLVFHTSDIRAALETLAVEFGIRERVRFVGKLQSSDLASAYQLSDALVLPSFTEALPSVVTESMLCGTPVIATNVGGIREQLGGFGLLIEPRSETSLANGLNHLFAEYRTFQKQGPAMSAHAQARSSVPDMIRSHIALYSRLAGVGHTRRPFFSRWPIGPLASGLVRAAAMQRRHRCR